MKSAVQCAVLLVGVLCVFAHARHHSLHSLEPASSASPQACIDYLASYPMDSTCNPVEVLGACPCDDLQGCSKLVTKFLSLLDPPVQEKAKALMVACTALLTGAPAGHKDTGVQQDGASKISTQLLAADGPVVNVDDEQTRKLVDMSEPGGDIEFLTETPSDPPTTSPFDNLALEDYPYLMRLMWWAARYTYTFDAHYSALVQNSDDERVPEAETKIDVEPFVAVKGEKGAKIDALIVVVRPHKTWTYTKELPSRWYCHKYFENEFCDDDRTEFLHVSVRGMRMYNDLTTPDSDDLMHMRGMNQIVKCRFSYNDQILSMRIAEGSCEILQALVSSGMIPHLVNKFEAGHKYMIVFHGLSYGGAVAQPATVLFHWALNVHREHLPVDLDTDIRLGMVLFGSPRVGDRDFAEQFRSTQIPADQFVMYTYVKGQDLFYDSVAMHPEHLYPVGNVLSMVYYAEPRDSEVATGSPLQASESSITTELHHDLFVSESHPFHLVTTGAETRKVPDSTTLTFFCLHFFHKYQAFFENRFCPTWCNPVRL